MKHLMPHGSSWSLQRAVGEAALTRGQASGQPFPEDGLQEWVVGPGTGGQE